MLELLGLLVDSRRFILPLPAIALLCSAAMLGFRAITES